MSILYNKRITLVEIRRIKSIVCYNYLMKRYTKIGLLLFAFITMPQQLFAHVRYIASDDDVAKYGGIDFAALLEPLTQPVNIFLIVVTCIIILALYWLLNHNRIFHKWSDHMAKVGESYKVFVPWMARLALGIALLGAGTSNYLISPVLTNGGEMFSFIQILLGFFLMAGILVGPTAVATLLLFIFALTQDSYLLGSFDILALILSILVVDSRLPGVDDIVGIPDFTHIAALRAHLPLILRSGVGIAMAYLAIYEKILNPHLSSFVVEVTNLVNVIPVSSAMWTLSAGIIELAIGLTLIAGFKTRLTSVVAIIVLSMSFFYFGESVISHVTLFGILAIVFVMGPGTWSVDALLRKMHGKKV